VLYARLLMSSSVRSSTAFGVTLALAFGVAAGWLLGGGEQGDINASQESWLFSHTADAGEIRERADGSLELVLRSFDERVTAFADRPFRDAKIETVEWLVSAWDDLFAESAPNAVLVEHDPDGVAKSVVVELSSPRLSGGELTYAVTVLDAIPEGRLARVAGESHENPVRSFRAVSLFIDDVTLSCVQNDDCSYDEDSDEPHWFLVGRLDMWNPADRMEFAALLVERGILGIRWEDNQLLVSEDYLDSVEDLLDEFDR